MRLLVDGGDGVTGRGGIVAVEPVGEVEDPPDVLVVVISSDDDVGVPADALVELAVSWLIEDESLPFPPVEIW